jgi:hypothetical protein
VDRIGGGLGNIRLAKSVCHEAADVVQGGAVGVPQHALDAVVGTRPRGVEETPAELDALGALPAAEQRHEVGFHLGLGIAVGRLLALAGGDLSPLGRPAVRLIAVVQRVEDVGRLEAAGQRQHRILSGPAAELRADSEGAAMHTLWSSSWKTSALVSSSSSSAMTISQVYIPNGRLFAVPEAVQRDASRTGQTPEMDRVSLDGTPPLHLDWRRATRGFCVDLEKRRR